MDEHQTHETNQRVVILAPTPQDAHVCGKILHDVNIAGQFLHSIEQVCEAITTEIGAALIAEEFLTVEARERIRQTLSSQPAWSDFPLLVLLASGEHTAGKLENILLMGHVTLVQRPLRIAAFVNTLRAKLRDRRRQYTVRDLLMEREKTIDAARQAALRIEMALRAGGMAAWEHSQDEVYWSPQMFDLLGVPADIKPTIEAALQQVHPDDIHELRRKWYDARDRDKAFQHEFRIQHPRRGVRWIAVVGEPVQSRDGQVLRQVGVNWDVTTRRVYEQSLQEARLQAEVANQSKSAFLANMSHEIRTPMTAILGYTDLIAERITDEQTLQHVRTIRRNGEFLLDIINDILDLSKIEAGKFEITPERFALNRVFEDVQSIMEVRAAEGNLKLELEYQGKIPAEIESDPKRLKQILINLVGNAIKFTKEGSVKVMVSYIAGPEQADRNRAIACKSSCCAAEYGQLRFDIVDTGVGMSQAQQKRLFQPFSQGDHRVNRQYGGTGLGLAISQRLATMLGGTIQVVSEEGKGSTFTVYIATGAIDPARMIQPSVTKQAVPHVEATEEFELDCRILVVDDRREIRFLSRKFLSDAGATVSEAEDGELAVAAVTEAMKTGESFDVVMLDMQMPKLDGYETARTLRRLGYHGPIIALTADAMQGDMARCIECGCNDYLSKPIDKAVMLRKIRSLLGTPKL